MKNFARGGPLRAALASILLLGSSAPVLAAQENLGSDNSTLGTAQLVSFSEEDVVNVFGLRGTVDIFGITVVDDHNADFYKFDVETAGLLTLSITTPSGPISEDDPMIALFALDGSLLGLDDDGGPGYDSLLSVVGDAGTYIAAVTGWDDFDFDGLSDGDPAFPADSDFLYTLQITSGPGPVPLPAPLVLLGSALAGLLAVRRRA